MKTMTQTTHQHLNASRRESGGRRSQIERWAIRIKQRDRRCKICDSPYRLEAHHILQKSKYPDLKTDLTNGITLCHKCHAMAHSGQIYAHELHQLI